MQEATCKVQECDEAHSKHYCRLCEDTDSSHFARDCPSGVDLWHGTRCSKLSKISEEGMKTSTFGRIGPGVYFTTEKQAFTITEFRGTGTGYVVLNCRVNLGKCEDLSGHSTISSGYDSAKGMHPAWAGISSSFQEWTLKNPKKLRIKEVHMVGGTIDGNLYLPRVLIKIYNSCRFKGLVTAGTMTGDTMIIG